VHAKARSNDRQRSGGGDLAQASDEVLHQKWPSFARLKRRHCGLRKDGRSCGVLVAVRGGSAVSDPGLAGYIPVVIILCLDGARERLLGLGIK
jgi:hypothetical protein